MDEYWDNWVVPPFPCFRKEPKRRTEYGLRINPQLNRRQSLTSQQQLSVLLRRWMHTCHRFGSSVKASHAEPSFSKDDYKMQLKASLVACGSTYCSQSSRLRPRSQEDSSTWKQRFGRPSICTFCKLLRMGCCVETLEILIHQLFLNEQTPRH